MSKRRKQSVLAANSTSILWEAREIVDVEAVHRTTNVKAVSSGSLKVAQHARTGEKWVEQGDY